MRWQDKLTKKELKHLRKDAGCRTLQQVKDTVKQHEKWRKEFPKNPDPCFDCFIIGQKLGLIL